MPICVLDGMERPHFAQQTKRVSANSFFLFVWLTPSVGMGKAHKTVSRAEPAPPEGQVKGRALAGPLRSKGITCYTYLRVFG